MKAIRAFLHTIWLRRVDLYSYSSCFASSGHLFDYSDGTTTMIPCNTRQSTSIYLCYPQMGHDLWNLTIMASLYFVFGLRVDLRQLTTLCQDAEYLASLFAINFVLYFVSLPLLYCYRMIWTKILYMLQVYCLVSSMICAILKQGHFLLLGMPFSYFHFSLIKFTSRVNHV